MKVHSTLLLGLLARAGFAQTDTDVGGGASPTSTTGSDDGGGSASPTSTPSGGNGGGGDSGGTEGFCYIGNTYCGWMLELHNGFNPDTINKAYCAGTGGCSESSGGDSGSGSSNSSYQKGLYICLPAGAKPRAKTQAELQMRFPFKKLAGDTTAAEPTAAPTAVATGESTGGPDPTPTSSTCGDTRPHEIELLCACGGDGTPEQVCLDPNSDQIGRCVTACHN